MKLTTYIVKIDKPKTSSVFAETSSKLIKETISNITHPLTRNINKSLNIGIVSDQLELARVISVSKLPMPTD